MRFRFFPKKNSILALWTIHRDGLYSKIYGNIKFCVKLEKMATETLKMLHNVYGDSSCQKRFVKDREDVEDDPKSGRPCTFTTDTNIEKFRQLVCSDCRLTICVIANKVGMDKETVHTILDDTLGMQKVCG